LSIEGVKRKGNYNSNSPCRLNARPRTSQFSCQRFLDPCGEDELFPFVALIENLGLPVNLGEELSIVERQPDLS
jgi:hypothetical protein